jgi:UTP--glucose-1-phosphate uridylyltransferase
MPLPDQIQNGVTTRRTVTKAVIPAAGLGTRFLPATKATPKEMLPLVDTPVIQYIVEEAARAGLEDVLMITGRNKRALEDHFDAAYELEATLASKGDTEKLRLVQNATHLADVHYVRQGEPKGLGHAVLCAARHVGNEPFAVLLGDDVIDRQDDLLRRMLEVRDTYGGSVVALMPVDSSLISMYGAAAVEATGEDDVVRITELVEKPPAHEAPSNLAVIGRYVPDPAIFPVLATTPPGRGGEIQLTDGINALTGRSSADGGPVHGVIFTGRRYDTGDRAEYLRTIVRFAAARADLGPDFVDWLRTFLAEYDDQATAADAAGAPGNSA